MKCQNRTRVACDVVVPEEFETIRLLLRTFFPTVPLANSYQSYSQHGTATFKRMGWQVIRLTSGKATIEQVPNIPQVLAAQMKVVVLFAAQRAMVLVTNEKTAAMECDNDLQTVLLSAMQCYGLALAR